MYLLIKGKKKNEETLSTLCKTKTGLEISLQKNTVLRFSRVGFEVEDLASWPVGPFSCSLFELLYRCFVLF